MITVNRKMTPVAQRFLGGSPPLFSCILITIFAGSDIEVIAWLFSLSENKLFEACLGFRKSVNWIKESPTPGRVLLHLIGSDANPSNAWWITLQLFGHIILYVLGYLYFLLHQVVNQTLSLFPNMFWNIIQRSKCETVNWAK